MMEVGCLVDGDKGMTRSLWLKPPSAAAAAVSPAENNILGDITTGLGVWASVLTEALGETAVTLTKLQGAQ